MQGSNLGLLHHRQIPHSDTPGKPQRSKLFCIVALQSLTHAQLFATVGPQHTRFLCTSLTPRLPLTLQLMSIDLVMPSNHLVLCHPLLLLPSIFPSMRVFSNELALRIRWSEYWSFSFRISPSNEYSGFI